MTVDLLLPTPAQQEVDNYMYPRSWGFYLFSWVFPSSVSLSLKNWLWELSWLGKSVT